MYRQTQSMASLWVTVGWVLALACSAAHAQCPSQLPVNLMLSLGSRRNETGHWVISGDAWLNRDLKSLATNGHDIILQVGHGVSYKSGGQCQHLTFSADVAGGLASGYRAVSGLGFYKTHEVAVTWEEAQHRCLSEGAHLLVIDSEGEENLVKEYFGRKLKIPNAKYDVYVHVGVHDRYTEGHYESVLGDVVPTSGNPAWHPGQPNGGSENCVVATVIGKYADAPCDWKLAFICEF